MKLQYERIKYKILHIFWIDSYFLVNVKYLETRLFPAGPKAINPESGTLTRDGMAQINAAANIGVDDLRRMCILR